MSTKQNVLAEIYILEMASNGVAKRMGGQNPGRNALHRMRTAVNKGDVPKARQEMVAAISAFNYSDYKKDLGSYVRKLTQAFRLWAD